MGMRDLENGTVEVARRDTKVKETISFEGIANYIENLLKDIQQSIYNKALAFKEANTHSVETYEEFKQVLEAKGGFIYAHWDGTSETEEKIKEETKATIRCVPLDAPEENGVCMYSGKPSSRRVVFARAY
jgi:prolyl-tRNA synthetase